MFCVTTFESQVNTLPNGVPQASAVTVIVAWPGLKGPTAGPKKGATTPFQRLLAVEHDGNSVRTPSATSLLLIRCVRSMCTSAPPCALQVIVPPTVTPPEPACTVAD